MATKYLYVNGFNEDSKQWTTHNGLSPYLNDSSDNSISTYTTDQIDMDFSFEDTDILWAVITKVEIELETITSTELVGAHVALSLDGVTFTEKDNVGFDGTSTWIWSPALEVTSFFGSQADINACVMRLTSHRSGASASIAIRRARLKITYTEAVIENIMDGLVQC